jgi:hypothetical protein
MTITLSAQPYDITAKGFYSESAEEYRENAAAKTNRYGIPVEEFEIQFIDGAPIDAALAGAVGLNQGNVGAFFERVDEWDIHQKRGVIIATRECGQGTSIGSPRELIEIVGQARLPQRAENAAERLPVFDRKLAAGPATLRVGAE